MWQNWSNLIWLFYMIVNQLSYIFMQAVSLQNKYHNMCPNNNN